MSTWLVGAVLAALACSAPATAQEAERRVMTGTVVFDDEPVAGALVELHRVSRGGAGAVEAVEADSHGRFEIEYEPAAPEGDFVVHFPTAMFRGVRYFGPVVHREDPPEGLRIEVYDTVSVSQAEPVEVGRRDVVIVQHGSGGWEVNELIRLGNPADRTIVSSSGRPIWEHTLPQGASEIQIGEGEMTSEAIHLMEGRIILAGPLLPGDREIFIRYRLGQGASPRTRFPVTQETALMSVLVRQPSPRFNVAGLGEPAEIEVEGDRFVRYAAAGVPADRAVLFQWEGNRQSPLPPALVAGLIVGLILLSTGLIALRRRAA